MQLKPSFLTLAFGLALAPFAAQAQDIELVTEATVTVQGTFGTSVTTTNGKTGTARVDTTRSYNSTISTPDVIRSLLELSPTDSIEGWRLAAVRALPADQVEVDFSFYLYLVNETLNERRRVPVDKFFGWTNTWVSSATVNHVTRNIMTGKGVRTVHAEMEFLPSFTRKELPAIVSNPITEGGRTYVRSAKTEAAFTLDNVATAGFATINFSTRTAEPVFFFAIENIRYTAKGDFSGTLINTKTTVKKFTTRGIPDEVESVEIDETPTPAGGLVSFQVNVSAAKLVPRTLYPEVPFDPYSFEFALEP